MLNKDGRIYEGNWYVFFYSVCCVIVKLVLACLLSSWTSWIMKKYSHPLTGLYVLLSRPVLIVYCTFRFLVDPLFWSHIHIWHYACTHMQHHCYVALE
jgi:hypothetical protein